MLMVKKYGTYILRTCIHAAWPLEKEIIAHLVSSGLGAGQVARRFSASLRELRSRFVPETRALGRINIWIFRACLRLQLRGTWCGHRLVLPAQLLVMASELNSKSWSLSQWRAALCHKKEKSHVKLLKSKVHNIHSAWSLVQHHVQVKVWAKLYRSVGDNRGSKRAAWAKTRTQQSSRMFVLHGAIISCAGGNLASVTSNSFPQKGFLSQSDTAVRGPFWSTLRERLSSRFFAPAHAQGPPSASLN